MKKLYWLLIFFLLCGIIWAEERQGGLFKVGISGGFNSLTLSSPPAEEIPISVGVSSTALDGKVELWPFWGGLGLKAGVVNTAVSAGFLGVATTTLHVDLYAGARLLSKQPFNLLILAGAEKLTDALLMAYYIGGGGEYFILPKLGIDALLKLCFATVPTGASGGGFGITAGGGWYF
ncbi:MAG: hypothetical protein ACUVXI_18075 [bacterium]